MIFKSCFMVQRRPEWITEQSERRQIIDTNNLLINYIHFYLRWHRSIDYKFNRRSFIRTGASQSLALFGFNSHERSGIWEEKKEKSRRGRRQFFQPSSCPCPHWALLTRRLRTLCFFSSPKLYYLSVTRWQHYLHSELEQAQSIVNSNSAGSTGRSCRLKPRGGEWELGTLFCFEH